MRGLTSMLHERRSKTSAAPASNSTSSNNNSSNNNNNNNDCGEPRLGVRRTSSGVRQRTTAQALHHSSSHTNLNNTGSTTNASKTHNHHRSKLLDALAHPAQAAAAAAAVSGHPGRKRKTCSLLVLTLVCLGVVHYAGTMYDEDSIAVQQQLAQEDPSKRRARLRSRTPSGMAENSRDTSTTTTTTKKGGGGLAAWVSHHYSQKSRPQNSQESAAKSNSQQSTSSNNKKSQLLQTRIQNTLKAAFVADAASMGTHWIYNLDELHILLQNQDAPEFRTPPLPKFYSSKEYPGHYRNGQSSPYGEQLWFVTNYVLQNDIIDMETTTTRTKTTTADDNDDNDASDPGSLLEPMSMGFQQWAETFGGRLDQASLEFLSCRRERLHAQVEQTTNNADDTTPTDDDEDSAFNNNGACGANDSQAHFFIKVIPMTCLLVGHPHRRQYVEQAIRVHQNHDQAVLFGLALSDLLERVLLMDDNDNDVSNNNNNNNNNQIQETYDNPYISRQMQSQPQSLQQALDATLRSLEEEHTDGWLHFALSLTEHHRQHDALVDAWMQARDNADIPMEQLAGQVGRSCHMPGALVLALQGLYRAADGVSASSSSSSSSSSATKTTSTTTKPPTSSLTHLHRGYDYYVHAMLGIPHHTEAPNKDINTALVESVRDNIRAAGDTCSRAIYLGAVLGAAYGPPPTNWWNQLEAGLADRVSHAAQVIAQTAARRLEQQQQQQQQQ